MAGPSATATATFSVSTFNFRAVSDRWQERQPLLKKTLKRMDSDVVCAQEVLTGEFGQERRVLPPEYHVFPCKAALFNLAQSGGLMRWYAHAVSGLLGVPLLRQVMVSLPAAVEAWRERLTLRHAGFRAVRDLAMAPFFGNSVACRIAEAHEIKHSTLVLGDWRAAQRIEFCIGQCEEDVEGAARQQDGTSGGAASTVGGDATGGQRSVVSGPGGFKVWVVNTHLDHEHTDKRQRQALAVCEWMDKEKADCSAIILCGDLNSPPHEAVHSVLRRLGYVSAYAARHGREPQGTWPTGIEAPLRDTGDFDCLDYVYVWTAPNHTVRVLDAEVYGLEPAEHDATLFPSDHAAVKATIQVSRSGSSALACRI